MGASPSWRFAMTTSTFVRLSRGRFRQGSFTRSGWVIQARRYSLCTLSRRVSRYSRPTKRALDLPASRAAFAWLDPDGPNLLQPFASRANGHMAYLDARELVEERRR